MDRKKPRCLVASGFLGVESIKEAQYGCGGGICKERSDGTASEAQRQPRPPGCLHREEERISHPSRMVEMCAKHSFASFPLALWGSAA